MRFDRHLLATGIPLIDRQHEAYAELVDQLFDLSMRGNVPKNTILEARHAAVVYAIDHFDAEEQLMRSMSYPAYEAHRAKHDKFRDWSDTLTTTLDPKIDLDRYAVQLSTWLVKWFCEQVQTDDHKLAVFMNRTARGDPHATNR